MTVRVINVIPVSSDVKTRLASISDRLSIAHHDDKGPDWVSDGLADPAVEILLAWSPPADLTRTPALRWHHVASSGVEFLDAPALQAAGVTVTNTSGIHAIPIAEYVLEAFLHIVKGVDARHANQLARGWPDEQFTLSGRFLRGRTVGIVGYGSIGREVGRLAAAFGMRVLAVRASAATGADSGYRIEGTGDPDGIYPERIVGVDGLLDVARESDFLLAALPATPATDGMIGADVIAALPADAWIVNVGRGNCIDEPALEAALRERRIGGAVLDVFATEPLPSDSPLWNLPNSVVTPHVSGGPPEIFDLMEDLLTQNLRRYLAGQPLLNQVDLTRLY